jgi:phage terminase large subunit
LFRQNGISVLEADNTVIDGISNVTTWLNDGRIHIVKNRCPNLIKEFESYIWDDKAQKRGEDKPLKENDHAMDALRYLIQTLYPLENVNLSLLKGGNVWG